MALRCLFGSGPPQAAGIGLGTAPGFAFREKEKRSLVPMRDAQTVFAQSRSTNFCTLPVEVIGRSRNTT